VVVLGLLIVLTPLGLLAPGTAFGEWAPEELGALVGYVPRGLAALSGWWSGLLPDYAVPILEGVPGGEVLGYLLSALMGVLLTALVWGILRWLLLRPRTRS